MSSSRDLFDQRSCLDEVMESAGDSPETDHEHARGPQGLGRLGRTIEGEIIPRLMLAHAGMRRPRRPTDAPAPTAQDVDALARAVLDEDGRTATALIDGLRSRGTPAEALLLDLIAPAARRLGALWDADVISFLDVTVGLGRLQHSLREIAPGLDPVEVPSQGRVLLAAVPGEQHILGLLMVEEFLRQAGFDAWLSLSGIEKDVLERVRSERFDAVGLSMSSATSQKKLCQLIKLIRRDSLNRGIVILVGGKAFVDDPSLAAEVDADATAVDGRDAIRQLLTRIRPDAPRIRGMINRSEGYGADGERVFR